MKHCAFNLLSERLRSKMQKNTCLFQLMNEEWTNNESRSTVAMLLDPGFNIQELMSAGTVNWNCAARFVWPAVRFGCTGGVRSPCISVSSSCPSPLLSSSSMPSVSEPSQTGSASSWCSSCSTPRPSFSSPTAYPFSLRKAKGPRSEYPFQCQL